MVRVIVADSHPVVRDSIRRILDRDPGVEVVGEASDFAEAVAKTRMIVPDVLLVNLHLTFGRDSSFRELKLLLKSTDAGILGISFTRDEDVAFLESQPEAVQRLENTLRDMLIPAIMRVAAACKGFPPALFPRPVYRSVVQ